MEDGASHVYYLFIFSDSYNLNLENAGFNSTLRQGNVTHHEYIQVYSSIA